MTPFLEELAKRRRFGMKPGLETIQELCAALGHPESAFSSIHIAGTNGKGAVAAILDAALRATGQRVGRYTSPHLVRLNERFFLNGAPADDATLDRLAARVAARTAAQSSSSSRIPDLTFFEALTAVAFLLYAEAQVDCAVLECGLGGRLDATNVCKPKLTVITKVGLDHCDWLGSTVEQIAAEKAGIIKSGVPIVLGCNAPSVRAVVEARAREVGAPFYYAPELASEAEIPADFSLQGSFNRENAVTALAALKVLGVSDLSGFARVVWPGRFQRVGSYLIDGAHNPPAARALARALSEAGIPPASLTLIFAACGDKDVDEVLTILKPFVRRGLATRTNNPRALSPDDLAARMNALGIPTTPHANLSTLLSPPPPHLSTSIPPPLSTSTTLICGSLFLVGEALLALGATPGGARAPDPSELLRPSVV